MATYLRVRSEDLRELAADLESADLGLGREITTVKREVAGIVAGRARRFSIRTPGTITGELADSIEARAFAVIGTKPQTAVHEFGGDIAPRGTAFHIEESAFALKAGAREQGRAERRLAEATDRLLDRLGL